MRCSSEGSGSTFENDRGCSVAPQKKCIQLPSFGTATETPLGDVLKNDFLHDSDQFEPLGYSPQDSQRITTDLTNPDTLGREPHGRDIKHRSGP